jgi:hypothetical protein
VSLFEDKYGLVFGPVGEGLKNGDHLQFEEN